MTTLSKRDNQLRFLLLISIVINVTTIIRRPVEAIVAHKVLHGKITGKSMVGKFLVTKEQYDNVQVGDDIPSYLRSY